MNPKLERFTAHIDRYAADDEQEERGRLIGRAVPYNVPDGRPGRYWDGETFDEYGWPEVKEYSSSIFTPDSFANWLDKTGGFERIAVLFQHGGATEQDPGYKGSLALPVAKLLSLRQEPDGLYFEAEWESHPMASHVRELAKRGTLKELSFGVTIGDFDVREEDGAPVRYVTNAALWDISVVVQGQFGPAAVITESYAKDEPEDEDVNPAWSDTDLEDRPDLYVGRKISAANAEALSGALAAIKSAAETLSAHADAIDAMLRDSAHEEEEPSEESDDEDKEDDNSDSEVRSKARNLLERLALRIMRVD
jgi:HK97 family phage prohead protease